MYASNENYTNFFLLADFNSSVIRLFYFYYVKKDSFLVKKLCGKFLHLFFPVSNYGKCIYLNTFIHTDPSNWNSEHIKTWLHWMAGEFNLNPAPPAALFPQTGTELVKLSKAEFCVCALSEDSGKTLAKYIAWKTIDATGERIVALEDEEDPGKETPIPIIL